MMEDILPAEQKVLRKGRRGCLDTIIIIDGAMAGEAKLYRRDLSMTWIDFKNDMVPHEWLRRMLEAIRNPQTTSHRAHPPLENKPDHGDYEREGGVPYLFQKKTVSGRLPAVGRLPASRPA